MNITGLPSRMNSRQRRKLEAKRHNDLLVEEEAYQEDRARDPEKYRVVRSAQNTARTAAAISAMLATSIQYYSRW